MGNKKNWYRSLIGLCCILLFLSIFTDEWLYFKYLDSSINTFYDVPILCKMKFDGSEFTKLVVMDYPNIYCSVFAVKNETVYFINSINNGGLYQMKTDGSDLKEIVKGYFGTLQLADNCIYLSTHYSNSSAYSYISKLNLDTNEYTKIYNKRAPTISIIDDFIYFADIDTESKIYQMKQDGTALTLVP